MIIENGTIEVKQKTAGGIDQETGYPIKSSFDWGEPIPCQIIVNNYNAQSVNNNEHVTSAAYTLLIDEQVFDAEQIRITNKYGKNLGEFSVKSIEQLEAVCQIKILV